MQEVIMGIAGAVLYSLVLVIARATAPSSLTHKARTTTGPATAP